MPNLAHRSPEMGVGCDVTMRDLGDASEDDVVLAFVQAEIDSPK